MKRRGNAGPSGCMTPSPTASIPSQQTKKRRLTDYFGERGDGACVQTHRQEGPPRAWGKLVQPSSVKEWSLRMCFKPQGPLFYSRIFTRGFKPLFNESYYRAPGLGVNNKGFWGGVKGSVDVSSSSLHLMRELSNESLDEQQLDSKGSEEDEAGEGMHKLERVNNARNFALMAAWAMGQDGLLCEQDRDTLNRVLMLSSAAETVFWGAYHSARNCYRVDIATREGLVEHGLQEGLEELMASGMLMDMSKCDVQQILCDIFDILSLLRVDELARLSLAVLGKAANGNRRIRADLLSSVEAILYNDGTVTLTAARRVGSETLNLLTRMTKAGVAVVAVPPGLRKLIHRVISIFCISSGYEAEDAVLLLRSDVLSLPFASDGGQAKGGDGAATPGPFRIQPHHLKCMDFLVMALDALHVATASGDATLAYGSLHAVSNVLLPREQSMSTSPTQALQHKQEHSLLQPFEIHGLGDSFLPVGYRGPNNLPLPLFHLAARCMLRGINLLERENRYDEAIHYTRMMLDATASKPISIRGRFWTRLVTDTCHLGRLSEGLRLCEEALSDPAVDGEDRLYLQKKCLSLCVPPRRWKRPTFSEVLTVAETVIELPLQAAVGSLETRVATFFLDKLPGYGGGHFENSIYLTLFGLLFFDVLWSGDGRVGAEVFLSPYQTAPLDLLLDSRNFVQRRKEACEQRLSQIENGQAETVMIDVHREHQGQLCSGVFWSSFALADLLDIACGLDSAALVMICRTLISDYALWRHGLPDLLLFKKRSKEERESPDPCVRKCGAVKCIEVKGPRDSLSNAQSAWIDKMVRCGVDVTVARVRDSSDRGCASEVEPGE